MSSALRAHPFQARPSGGYWADVDPNSPQWCAALEKKHGCGFKALEVCRSLWTNHACPWKRHHQRPTEGEAEHLLKGA